MDLGAYVQMSDLFELMKANGICIPRFRGMRIMSEETIIPDDVIEEDARYVYKETRRLYTPSKYCSLVKINGSPYDKREAKGHAKASYKRYVKQMKTFNKYVGMKDVIMIHARIGGWNWRYYGGPLISMEPWFIEKCDDGFDNTYCDVYVRVRRD